MKTIGLFCGLLGMSAALALAVDQETKKPADPKDTKTANGPTNPATHKRPNNGVVSNQPKRNLHQDTTAPAPTAMSQDQKAAAALPTVPKDAEEVGANLYRTTDAQGKHWLYRKTPFGVSKWEEKPGDVNGQSQQQPPPSASLTMKDLGDSVEFQRLTPFGPQKWVRKKSEMTEEEKASFETQEHARQAALGNKAPEQH
ncbi:MAG TPA: hypothetical protein VKT81_17425 [Bryobacteraceae bacterium]|nr:hypothetical protein [Bryobacteraceae bacterium]